MFLSGESVTCLMTFEVNSSGATLFSNSKASAIFMVVFTAVSAQQDQAYNIPRDMIATRIKENSGDYIVKPFEVS